MKFKLTPALEAQRLAHLLNSCFSRHTYHPHLQITHARSLVSGLSSDLFLNNLLLNGYSKSGRLREARKLFDAMPQRNIISWSSVISMYAQHGLDDEALALFVSFRRSFKTPNEFVLASVLRACVQLRAVGCAVEVHGLAVKTGFSFDVFVGTALINYYSKVGCIKEAVSVFDELPFRNSVTWTAVITGYSLAGRSEMSLRLFNRMREEGVEPDGFVLSSIASACSVLEFLEGGRQIHGYAYRIGMEVDISVSNVLIDLYSKCSRVRVARRLFDAMIVKNIVSWTTMIAGYMQNSYDAEAIGLFYDMCRSGWQTDGFACASILSSCGSLSALKEGKQVHGYAIKANLELDEYVNNGLIDMYAKCGSLADARAVFDAMAEHDVVSYNAMIEGYAGHEELPEAFTLFNRMRFRSLRPSLLTFVSLLGVSASLSAVNLSKQIHNLMLKCGVSLDLYAASALVDVYSKCSCVDDARAVFDEMEDKDLVVWNAMIFGYTQNCQGEEALKLFHQLRVSGMIPTDFTYVALVTVACNLASLFHGLQFHNQIIKAGADFDAHVMNALIDMYAKCGCIKEAWLLFDSNPGRDVACWNSMISRYAQHGLAEDALRIFRLMRNEEIGPNYITFVGVLSACDHGGLVDEGLSHFYSMKWDFGIEPGMEHYASIVNLMGRAGKLHEAKEFIQKMPIEPGAIVWRSLLSACRAFGNVEMGRYAAKMAMLMDPKDSGSHVLLSNIYASKGMWAAVEEVRKGMDSIGVEKEPGYSWIEVMKEVHVFIARGREHLQADLIYWVLDGLTELMRDIGYEDDTSLLSLTQGDH